MTTPIPKDTNNSQASPGRESGSPFTAFPEPQAWALNWNGAALEKLPAKPKPPAPKTTT